MKLTKTSKSLLLAGGALLAFAVWQMDHPTQCAGPDKVTCIDAQQSWVSWLSGDSRSAQFHFVDFLELVSRMLPANSSKS